MKTSKTITKGEVMSASKGGTSRKRLSLLAGSSLVASLAVVGGAALTPTTAAAQATCVPAPASGNGTNTVVYNAGTYNPGITCAYVGTGATVSTAGAITVGSTAGGNGVNLTATGADAVTWVSTAGTVTGGAQNAGPVIDASSVSGAISITTAAITGTTIQNTYGVNAVSSGGGAVSVTNTTGNVNVTSAAGAQQAAIRAVSTGGNGAVSVTTAGTVTGRLVGIQGQSSGTGALTITATGNVATNATAGVANIDATTGTGLLTVNVATGTGTINGNAGAAIRTSAGGDAVINIASGRNVQAGATSTGVLNLTAVGTTTVNNAGILGSTAAVTIRAAGGAFVLNNDATLRGPLDLTGVMGVSTVNNAGQWLSIGTSAFGPGDDVVTNTGEIIARDAATIFTSLETIENAGAILFGEQRGGAGDRLSAPGTAFTASGSSQLLMEAMLGTAGQADCSAAVVADCFSLLGGSTSGVTSILVTVLGDITTDANTAGIVLVDVNGGESHAGDFVLDTTTIGYTADSVYGAIIRTDGLLGFAIQYDEANQRHFLGSVIPGNRVEYVAALQEVVSIWHSTSDTIAGRQADLRDGGGRGAWVRVTGESTTRDVDLAITASGADFSQIDEYELQTTTAIGGVDLVGGDNFVLGIHGGGVKAKLERAISTTVDQIDGVTVGVYGGWWNESGLTLDGTINANLLSIDHDRPVEEVSGTSVTAIGARGEAGWRMPLGQGFYVQPLATVAYMRAEIEEVFQTGFDASWSDVSSARAALGLRAGGDLGPVGFWVAGRAWKDFTNDGVLLLGTTAEEVEIHDDFTGEFQELGAGLILSAGEALEGFVSGGAKFADDADNYSASIGLRLRW